MMLLKAENIIKLAVLGSFFISIILIYKSEAVDFRDDGWVMPLISLLIYMFWNRILFDNLWHGEVKISYSVFLTIGVILSIAWLCLNLYLNYLYIVDSPLFY